MFLYTKQEYYEKYRGLSKKAAIEKMRQLENGYLQRCARYEEMLSRVREAVKTLVNL